MLFTQLKQIILLLNPNQKVKFGFLSFFMFIGMLFEIVGISLLIPALGAVIDSNLKDNYPFLIPIINFFGNPPQTTLALYAMLFIIIFYIIKASYLIFLSKIQSIFVYDLQKSISQKLFNGYLDQDYAYHIENNSSHLIRNVTTEVNTFIDAGVKQMLFLIVESFVILGILALLLIIEPLSSIFIFLVLGGSSYLFYFFTKTKSYKWGTSRQVHEGKKIQHLQQSLTGIKEVKLFGRENSFKDYFYNSNFAVANVESKQFFLTLVPRIFLETLAVFIIIILIITLLLQGKPAESLIPILGVFAAAAFRTLPSVTRVLHAIQSLRYSLPITNLLVQEFESFSTKKVKKFQNSTGEIEFKDCFELKNINFKYKNSKKAAINNISLKIKKGEAIGFIGQSGAGKSTLVDIIMGLLEPDDGYLSVDGKKIEDLRLWQNKIGYVPQSIYLTDDTLERNIAFGIKDKDINREYVMKAIRDAQLEPVLNSSENGLDMMLGERGVRLSGGQIQRVGIARALYANPEIIVLDEASSALDSATEKEIIDSINLLAGNKTIIMIAHRTSTLSGCNVVYELEDGVIKNCGSYEEITKN